jgi:N-acyl homoserine lactone hydrolase
MAVQPFLNIFAVLTSLLIFTTGCSAKDLPIPQVRLYAMDCGRLEISNLAAFADTGEYDGHPGELMASCFLIVHPKGILLWDTGLGDKYAVPAGGTKLHTAVVPETVAAQLAELGLSYDDINYFAFSHAHADHVGNANELKKATWIIDSRETDWWQSMPTPERVNPALLSAYSSVTVKNIRGDYDVFGDGSVKMLWTPGHTPGHHVLMVTVNCSTG